MGKGKVRQGGGPVGTPLTTPCLYRGRPLTTTTLHHHPLPRRWGRQRPFRHGGRASCPQGWGRGPMRRPSAIRCVGGAQRKETCIFGARSCRVKIRGRHPRTCLRVALLPARGALERAGERESGRPSRARRGRGLPDGSVRLVRSVVPPVAGQEEGQGAGVPARDVAGALRLHAGPAGAGRVRAGRQGRQAARHHHRQQGAVLHLVRALRAAPRRERGRPRRGAPPPRPPTGAVPLAGCGATR